MPDAFLLKICWEAELWIVIWDVPWHKCDSCPNITFLKTKENELTSIKISCDCLFFTAMTAAFSLSSQPKRKKQAKRSGLMTQTFTGCSLLVLLTKALQPPPWSERWLVHKARLRLHIIPCCWCNYAACSEHKGAKIPLKSAVIILRGQAQRRCKKHKRMKFSNNLTLLGEICIWKQCWALRCYLFILMKVVSVLCIIHLYHLLSICTVYFPYVQCIINMHHVI